jgi:CPA1 family monovalent cation:H+ antiporter
MSRFCILRIATHLLFFAIPVMLLSTVVAAVAVYYGIGHPTGFPWIAALLTGALLATNRLRFAIHVDQRVTLIAAYASYLIAEHFLQVSGVMSVLVAGIVLGKVIHHDFSAAGGSDFVDDFWTFNVYVAEALMFLLMGVTITVGMFSDNWLAMLIGIATVLIARAIGVFGGAALISKLPGVEVIPIAYRRVMFLGGLRGAVTLALALSLPTDLSYWWTIQSIAFGVVLFTLFVQAPMIGPMLKKEGLQQDKTDT